MFLTIGSVLSKTALLDIHSLLDQLDWHDGSRTAGKQARRVKRNEQADLNSTAGKALVEIAHQSLTNQSVLQAAARPKTYSRLLLSRTRKDGGYGAHIDNAIMGKGDSQFRSDLSFTLFLSNPLDYEGGELSLVSTAGTQSIKLEAGDLVLYPSTLIHEVTPVTSGERLVLAGWIESHIRDISKREILFDLERVRTTLAERDGSDAERLLLDKTISNLLRLWAGV